MARDLLPLVEEQKAIFARWEEAMAAGSTGVDTHPALPSDRPRWDQIEAALDEQLSIDVDACEHVRPEFRRITPPTGDWEVNWLP